MNKLYRFDNGHLFILRGDAYVHCYYSIHAPTMELAIKAYNEENEMLGFGI